MTVYIGENKIPKYLPKRPKLS